MSTTVLAYLILFMGFITFLCGAFGVLMLLFEEAGPAAAAADPWQGVISTRNRTPHARL
jgi:hypothetical protein